MTTIPRLVLYYGIVMIQTCLIASENAKHPKIVATKTFHSSDGTVGVVSVAEVTSRNGKISSSGGVKLYPPVGTKLNRNSNVMQPWIFSKKTDNGFAMGAVQAYPSAVVAAAASYGQPKSGFRQTDSIINWPVLNNIYPQTFSARTHQNPSFPDYMFKDFNTFIPDFGGGNAGFKNIYDPFVDIWN